MYNKESLDKIEIMQRHVDKLNEGARNSPFSFTWSPPTNHRSGQELDYFCVHMHHSMVQESLPTEDDPSGRFERNHPLSTLFYFGQAKNLESRVKVSSVRDLYNVWNRIFNHTVSHYMNALTSIALGEENVNWHIQSENKKLSTEEKTNEN